MKRKNMADYKSSIEVEKQKRKYVGIIGKTKFKITAVYDHLFLMRVYGGEIRMSWRFNKEGRIDLVDAKIFSENDAIYNLLTVVDFAKIKPDWWVADAIYYPLPDKACLLNPGFNDLDLHRKHQSILRFGHSMAYDVIDGARKGRILDPSKPVGSRKKLSDIVNDTASLGILEKAGNLFPSIVSVGMSGICTISYDKFNR